MTASSDQRRARLDAYVTQMESAPGDVSRREFVTLLGASMALAGLDACTRMPPERVLPYVLAPELTPGVAQHYATSMVVDGFATGLIVESHEGRPTKVEGNPEHPASLGAAGVFEQASVLQLYSPHRARHVRHGDRRARWQDFARAFAPATLHDRVGARGERLRVLLEPTSSPTEAALLARVSQRYPAAGIHFHSVTSASGGLAWTSLPQYDVGAADVIVAIDADFLASGPFHLRHARAFAERRRPDAGSAMNRLYAMEPAPTVTGLTADHRLALRPSDIEPTLAALLRAISAGGPDHDDAAGTDARDAFIAAAADDLRRHRGRSLVIGGTRLRARERALVDALNDTLGNADRTVWFTPSPIVGAGDQSRGIESLAEAIRAGTVDTLVCIGANPCYASPGALGFGELMRRVPQTAYVGLYENETASRCDWMVPATHYLESWGDARAYDGTLSMVQPLIDPLYGGKTTAQVLAALVGDPAATAHDLVRAAWIAAGGSDDGWREAVGRGLVRGSAFARTSASISRTRAAIGGAGPRAAFTTPADDADGCLGSRRGRESARAVELVFAPDARVYDGCFADNAWLQELPDPITTLTWGNAAWISARTAARCGVGSGDHLEIRIGARRVELPAILVAGQADDTIALHFGYGRDGAEALARRVGASVYPLWEGVEAGDASVTRADVHRLEGHSDLAVTQGHRSLQPYTPARRTTVAELQRAHATTSRALTLYEPRASLPDGAAAHQWAMTIDLSMCIGCGACMVACQAENNVPVVGAHDVRRGREMHWLRVDRYLGAASDRVGTLDTVAQPMLCQQCEKAPCEYVCPVEATVHSPDGLNEMVYNRCVGTRFCSNNCPYKVRRFNWFDYNAELSETEKMAKNPDVTVRERGVMEKCTFCVQRIREAEIAASVDGRAGVLERDEVRTACQQACPTRAIVFGSLTDRDSAVHRGRDGPRAYAALEELGTKPRVRYLARVRNPHPDLDARP